MLFRSQDRVSESVEPWCRRLFDQNVKCQGLTPSADPFCAPSAPSAPNRNEVKVKRGEAPADGKDTEAAVDWTRTLALPGTEAVALHVLSACKKNDPNGEDQLAQSKTPAPRTGRATAMISVEGRPLTEVYIAYSDPIPSFENRWG